MKISYILSLLLAFTFACNEGGKSSHSAPLDVQDLLGKNPITKNEQVQSVGIGIRNFEVLGSQTPGYTYWLSVKAREGQEIKAVENERCMQVLYCASKACNWLIASVVETENSKAQTSEAKDKFQEFAITMPQPLEEDMLIEAQYCSLKTQLKVVHEPTLVPVKVETSPLDIEN